jgi:predicted nucleic acid-binding protein
LAKGERREVAGGRDLRVRFEASGRTLAPLDLLIGPHALAISATLVSSDQAFQHCEGRAWEDWTA